MIFPRFRLFYAAVIAATLAGSSVETTAQDAPAPVVSEQTSARTSGRARIEMDEATNTLIITTDPATNEQIRQIIEALDQPVPQALINVVFVEVTHSNDRDIGVDIAYNSTDGGNGSVISSLFGVAAASNGGIVGILQNDLDVTIRALKEVGTLNVLSRPSILARNKQEATITIGQEVPFIRNSRTTETGQTINTVEYEDIGIILTVTPTIGADGKIQLQIAPEISTLTGETVAISDTVDAQVFAKRSAETNVVVTSGKTIVIGGLIDDQETKTKRQVPVLGSIPILGNAFKRTITTKTKTELLIFLTPTLITNEVDLAAATKAEQARTKSIPAETLERVSPTAE